MDKKHKAIIKNDSCFFNAKKGKNMKLDFLSRMYQEYNELDTKIIKLEKALKTKELDKREKQLLINQYEHMKAYREALNQRINYTKEKYSNL
jgi:hypothetical protein